ncbi:MAG: hypothetical protein J5I98_25065 [Phaeodactylibacter sp.]|nr:hypothetical protein [Phaeodactylibacter sp.]
MSKYNLLAILILMTSIFFGESCAEDQRKKDDHIGYKILFSDSFHSGGEYIGSSTFIFLEDFNWKSKGIIRELCDFSSWALCSGEIDRQGKRQTLHFINSVSAFNGLLWFHEDVDRDKLNESIMVTLRFIQENNTYNLKSFKCRLGCSSSRSERTFQITCDTVPKLDKKYREIST